jgi:hypothetical protein
VNCRSIKPNHIKRISDALFDKKIATNVTTKEDYAVFPYEVSTTCRNNFLRYSSALNRDPDCNIIGGKVATCISASTLREVETAVRLVVACRVICIGFAFSNH